MAERSWTKPQRDAIDGRGGSLLVSAAAGSGKTAVLVERAISLICGSEHPVDADRLLIVTFSNAAAAEMKQRISSRLSSLIRENPGNLFLQRQQSLLAGAQISTIHSFCLELIRQNFQNLDISPDFSIIDQGELEILRSECARESIEMFYQEDQSGVFASLVELLSSGRDDSRLVETMLRIYEFCRSHPYYEDWLDAKLELYDPTLPPGKTIWGQSLLRYARESLAYCLETCTVALDWLYGDEKLEKAYLPAFQSDLASIRKCLDAVEQEDWDRSVKCLAGFHFAKLGPVRGDDPVKQRAKEVRDRTKKTIQELGQKYLNATEEQFREDIGDLRPKIEVLFHLVKDFSARLDGAKVDQKRVDFSDLEHLTLHLLVERVGRDYRQTAQAAEIAARYDYVMVDEYQDTNEVQDLIFTSVSRNQANLFMVGDVKQSIYSFRQAMPEIFLKKKERFFPFDGTSYPAVINLDTNFRSRRQVTEAVNFLFGRLMSRELGEIDYNVVESLKSGASYPEQENASPELLVLDGAGMAGENLVRQEAAAIARRIRELVEEGYQIAEGAVTRRVMPRDICILLRSPRSRADVYVKELARHGVAAWAENAGGFLQAREVAMVLSVLKVLDNPLLDIDLAAALLSPLFGFTDDDVARIRLCRRGAPFFIALQLSAEEGNSKSLIFMEVFRKLRVLSAVLPADRLLMKLYELTDALAVARVMPLGESREANLHLLVEYAAAYHQMGYKKLAGFVGFLSRLEEREGDLSPASSLNDGANVVRIQSVHRSKGLEYPVVFLADAAKQFNKVDLRQNTLLHSKYGFACVRRDPKAMKQYPTIPMQAIRLEAERSILSEEMRILYVALTRAREKLIVTCATKTDLAKKLSSLHWEPGPEGKLPANRVGDAGSYADWVLAAMLHHPSGAALREVGRCETAAVLADENPWIVSVQTIEEELAEENGSEGLYRTAQADPELIAALKRRESYRYPHLAQTTIPTKLGVSAAAKGEKHMDYRFAARPKFMLGAAMTGAEKGNALHKFMQFADYEAARDHLEEEIRRMQEERFLTPAEAASLRKDKLRRFFSSQLAKRIFASGTVHRELRFTVECGREVLDGYIQGMDAQSKIVLQGVADCVFLEEDGAVIVDYKSDAVQEPSQLEERYRGQLELYRLLLGESLGVPVKECILYSFALSKEVPVCFS